jgi:DNA mismatch endonuclease (patch repair protein)
MAAVRTKNTAPEMAVRKSAHMLGYRFRLHKKDLPGSPDLVFPKHRLALFVHGCFWHRHDRCPKATLPKTRQQFWLDKFQANVARDAQAIQKLRGLGWAVEVIWECETGDALALNAKLSLLLSEKAREGEVYER